MLTIYGFSITLYIGHLLETVQRVQVTENIFVYLTCFTFCFILQACVAYNSNTDSSKETTVLITSTNVLCKVQYFSSYPESNIIIFSSDKCNQPVLGHSEENNICLCRKSIGIMFLKCGDTLRKSQPSTNLDIYDIDMVYYNRFITFFLLLVSQHYFSCGFILFWS